MTGRVLGLMTIVDDDGCEWEVPVQAGPWAYRRGAQTRDLSGVVLQRLHAVRQLRLGEASPNGTVHLDGDVLRDITATLAEGKTVPQPERPRQPVLCPFSGPAECGQECQHPELVHPGDREPVLTLREFD